MSIALFPEYSADDLAAGMRDARSRDDYEVFVAERPEGSLAGFVEVGTRPYTDGCDTSPVGYVEAWYVDPDARLNNLVSHAAHRRAGYEEVDRVVQFRKVLAPPGTRASDAT